MYGWKSRCFNSRNFESYRKKSTWSISEPLFSPYKFNSRKWANYKSQVCETSYMVWNRDKTEFVFAVHKKNQKNEIERKTESKKEKPREKRWKNRKRTEFIWFAWVVECNESNRRKTRISLDFFAFHTKSLVFHPMLGLF